MFRTRKSARANAIKKKIGDRTYYYCSPSWPNMYEQPEKELKAIKRKVAVTLMVVVAVAGSRVLALFGLVAV